MLFFFNFFNLSSIFNIGVVALYSLLYVFGGDDNTSNLDAVECDNPKTIPGLWSQHQQMINEIQQE